MKSITPREGDIFDVVSVGGHHFTIRYGYYEEAERSATEPIPIYPCFLKSPVYTREGHPLVTRIQDACEHYTTQDAQGGDGWCADCIHCVSGDEEIGICQNPHRRKRTDEALAEKPTIELTAFG